MNATTNTAAARVDEILAANDFTSEEGNLYVGKTNPQAGMVDRDKAIACELVKPTDIDATTGWFFGDIPAGCESPWIEA